MTALLMVLRADLRARWLAVVGLGVFAGLAAAAPLVALAGASRADSAFARFDDAFLTPDIAVDQQGGATFGGPPDAAVDAVADLDEVDVAGVLDALLMRPVGSDYGILFEFQVAAPRDEAFGRDVQRYRMVDGRPPDPARVDEAVVDEEVAAAHDLSPGDTLVLESWTTAARDALVFGEVDTDPEPDGPVAEVTVVGVYRNPFTLTGDFAPPSMAVTPAFNARYKGDDADHAGYYPGIVLALLADGVAPDDFVAAVEEIQSEYGGAFFVEPGGEAVGGAIDAKNAQVLALRLFALVSAAAAVAVVGLALSRHLRARPATEVVLRGVGLSRRRRVMVVAAGAAVAGAIAVPVAVAAAWLASSILPVGVAGRAEPDPGRVLHVAIVVGGAVVAGLVFALVGVVVGWGVTRRVDPSGVRPRSLARRLARVAPGVAASVGVRMALDGGSGRHRVPVGPALVGAVVGLGGVVAASVFNSSLDHLVRSSALYGWRADVYATVGPDRAAYEEVLDDLIADERVVRLSAETDTVLEPPPWSERRELYGTAIDRTVGPPLHTVLAGRLPEQDGQIALGPELADEWGVGVGDTIDLSGRGGEPVAYEVVGLSLGPEITFDESYRDGFVVAAAALDRLALAEAEGAFHGFLVEFAPGAEVAGIADLRERDLLVQEPQTPRAIRNLREVERFPLALAAFLGLLAAGFLVHALLSAVRIRRRDLAVLKTIGLRRGQVRQAVAWQATTIIAVGLVIGLPAGFLTGRTAFDLLADALSVPLVVRVPALLGIVAAGSVVLANVIAALPASRAARTRPADLLRTE